MALRAIELVVTASYELKTSVDIKKCAGVFQR